jgi:hypothetical protein
MIFVATAGPQHFGRAFSFSLAPRQPHRRFPRPWSIEELEAMTADQPMTAEQAATLKRLAEAAYELEAFQPNLTRAEADPRISMLTAKLKLLDGPPHTL